MFGILLGCYVEPHLMFQKRKAQEVCWCLEIIPMSLGCFPTINMESRRVFSSCLILNGFDIMSRSSNLSEYLREMRPLRSVAKF